MPSRYYHPGMQARVVGPAAYLHGPTLAVLPPLPRNLDGPLPLGCPMPLVGLPVDGPAALAGSMALR